MSICVDVFYVFNGINWKSQVKHNLEELVMVYHIEGAREVYLEKEKFIKIQLAVLKGKGEELYVLHCVCIFSKTCL